MRKCVRWLATLSMLAFVSPAKAEVVTIRNTVQGDFVFTATAAGELAFGAPANVPLSIRTLGLMEFLIDDNGSDNLLFTGATGQLPGVTPPTPPGLLPFYITPVRFDGGAFNVTARDGLGRITSGTIVDLGMPWEMIGTGPNDGVVLYGDQETTPLLFSGDVSIDYSSGFAQFTTGSVIAGPEVFNVYALVSGDRVNQLPGTDPLVFHGSNRTLTMSAVPEPSSMAICLLSGTAIFVRRRMSKRQTIAA